MLKKSNRASNNVSDGVQFLLKCAKKRRTMALASARVLNSEMGVNKRIIAIT